MEFKWAAICCIVVFGGALTAMAVEKYQVNQCRIVSVQAGKTADEIAKICR